MSGWNEALRRLARSRDGPYNLLMGRRGAGLGFVAVLIAAVIVLILAARAWNSVQPTALQVMKPGGASSVPDHGDRQAAEALRSGKLPDLKAMKRSTDHHAAEVKEVSKASND